MKYPYTTHKLGSWRSLHTLTFCTGYTVQLLTMMSKWVVEKRL